MAVSAEVEDRRMCGDCMSRVTGYYGEGTEAVLFSGMKAVCQVVFGFGCTGLNVEGPYC